MIDTNAAFRVWLLQSQPLGDLVGQSIYCPDLPEHFDPANGPCLVFATRGGTSHPYYPVIRPRVQITAWADTAVDARAVYAAVHDLIHGAQGINLGSVGFILSALETVHGQDITDTETGWATVVAFYELTMRSE